jgi:hypothetical protein
MKLEFESVAEVVEFVRDLKSGPDDGLAKLLVQLMHPRPGYGEPLGKIRALRIYRQATGASLKEAREALGC